MLDELVEDLLTTDGHGHRLQMSVAGEVTTYTLDYAAGSRLLFEEGGTFSDTKHYLYGLACLAEQVDAEEPETEAWRYYQRDGNSLVRQTTDEQAEVTLAWTYSPEGAVLVGEEGPVTNLDCAGNAIYDFSTGLIFKNGNFFDPSTGIWVTLSGAVVYQAWLPYKDKKPKGRRNRKRLLLFVFLLLMVLLLSGCRTDGGVSVNDATATPCPPGPYNPPSEDNSIVLRINIVKLHGISVNWKEHVDDVDRIFDVADISVRAELKPSLSQAETNKILEASGQPNNFNIDNAAYSLKTEEECNLITSSDRIRNPDFDCTRENVDINNPSTYDESLNPRFTDGRITMYYVPNLVLTGRVARGKAYRLEDGDPPSFAVSAANGNSVVWGHELGHVLGLLHVNNQTNLMHSPEAVRSNLEQWQIEKLQQNAALFDGY